MSKVYIKIGEFRPLYLTSSNPRAVEQIPTEFVLKVAIALAKLV